MAADERGDERSRYALHQKLDQLLGADEAGTLMEHLPPVGWGDLLTKQDLLGEVDGLRRDLKASETYVIGTFRAELAAQTRTTVLTVVGGMAGVAALVLATVRL